MEGTRLKECQEAGADLHLGRQSVSISVIFLAYFLFSIILFYNYSYMINPDGISYITIAREYLHKDFVNALNGYWGPLLSWLLLPFLYFDLNELLSIKLLSILIGGVTLYSAYRLGRQFGLKNTYNLYFITLLLAPISYFSVRIITPDLLMLCLLCFYLTEIFSYNYCNNKTIGMLCGFWGGLIYFAKYYGFPFFIFHFILFNALHLYNNNTLEKRKTIITNFILGMVIFSLMSGTWIYLLSNKYHYFTFSNTSKYNFALIAPNSKGHPMNYQGLLKPVNDNAVSVWEDPSYLSYDEFNPFETFSYFRHFAYNFLRNLCEIVFYCLQYSFFAISVGLLGCLFLKKHERSLLNNPIFFAYLTIILYCSGYALLSIQFRYLYIVYLLLTLVGVYILSHIMLLLKNHSKSIRWFILVLFFFSILYMPVTKAYEEHFKRKGIHIISGLVRNEIQATSKIASNGRWHNSLYMSYLNSYKYFGISKEKNNYNKIVDELKMGNIDYYIRWIGELSVDADYKLDKSDKRIKVMNGNTAVLDIISIK